MAQQLRTGTVLKEDLNSIHGIYTMWHPSVTPTRHPASGLQEYLDSKLGRHT